MYSQNIQFTKIEIQIIKYVFKHYKNRYNPRQLARILNLNHSHVNKLCNSLLEKNLFQKENIGNSICFTFDYNDALALKFIEYILSLEAYQFPEWLRVLHFNLEKFNEHIKMGCVFGSSIKSKKFNDIDILLIYQKSKKAIINKIKSSIRKSELIDKPIRYVEISEKDLLKNIKNSVFYNILSENVVFCNSTNFVKVIKCLKQKDI